MPRKLVTLLDRGKTVDKLKRWIVSMLTRDPRKISKAIQRELQGTSVSDRAICRCLSQSGLCGRWPWRTPLMKRNFFWKMHVDKPPSCERRMTYGQMRHNWNFLARHSSSNFTDAKVKVTKIKNIVASMKHRGGFVLGLLGSICHRVVWICAGYHEISRISKYFREKCAPQWSVRKHRLWCGSLDLQRDNDPKHTAKNEKDEEKNIGLPWALI